MHQVTSFCSAALVLAAAQWYFTPTPRGPAGGQERPAGAAAANPAGKAPRPGRGEEEALRQLQHQLSWDRRPTAAVPHKGHTPNCRCQRPDRPTTIGADGLLGPDGIGAPRPARRAPPLPRALRREGP